MSLIQNAIEVRHPKMPDRDPVPIQESALRRWEGLGWQRVEDEEPGDAPGETSPEATDEGKAEAEAPKSSKSASSAKAAADKKER